MSIENNMFWNNFLNTYKTLVVLWDVKCDKYKNRSERNRAYEKLLVDYRRIHKNADIEAVKKRVINMRNVYRRELRKKLKAERSGEETFESSLWYFNKLHFLRGFEAPESRLTTLVSSDDSQTPRPAKRAKNEKKERQTLLRKASAHLDALSQAKTDGEVHAQSWARLFDNLPSGQKFFAEYMIDEALRLGHLNALTLNSTIQSPKSEPPSGSSRSSTPIPNIPMVVLGDSTQHPEMATSMPMHDRQLSGYAGSRLRLRCRSFSKEYSGLFGSDASQ